MKRLIVIGLAFGMLGLAACSSFEDFFRNVTAADCATPASQQAFIANLPGIALVSQAQMSAAIAQVCVGLYGTVAAPVTASGNAPVLKPSK